MQPQWYSYKNCNSTHTPLHFNRRQCKNKSTVDVYFGSSKWYLVFLDGTKLLASMDSENPGSPYPLPTPYEQLQTFFGRVYHELQLGWMFGHQQIKQSFAVCCGMLIKTYLVEGFSVLNEEPAYKIRGKRVFFHQFGEYKQLYYLSRYCD